MQGEGPYTSSGGTQGHTPAKGVWGKTLLFKIIFAHDTTIIHKMLRAACDQIPAMIPMNPALQTRVVQTITDVIDTNDLRLKQVLLLWMMCRCTPIQDYICTGVKGEEEMQAEDNDKANAFFAALDDLIVDALPRKLNPDHTILAMDMMHIYTNA